MYVKNTNNVVKLNINLTMGYVQEEEYPTQVLDEEEKITALLLVSGLFLIQPLFIKHGWTFKA